MRVVILSVLLVGVVVANVAFEEWTKQHDKVYTSWNEKEYRKGIWEKNLNKVLSHNIRFLKGETTYSMAMNHYGDLSAEEFRAHKKCLRYGNESNLTMPKVHYKGSTFLTSQLNASVPDAIDYRKLGFVTKIKDQGQCGSCWAFSTTGALEGQLFRKTGKLPMLSEQQLVDCAGKFGNYGCDGGLMEAAFTYIMSVKGLESEKSYPYTAEDGECTFEPSLAVGKDSGYLAVPAGNETMLTQALAELGPVSIAIDASQSSFQVHMIPQEPTK
eukprot:sb/3468163/